MAFREGKGRRLGTHEDRLAGLLLVPALLANVVIGAVEFPRSFRSEATRDAEDDDDDAAENHRCEVDLYDEKMKQYLEGCLIPHNDLRKCIMDELGTLTT